jgi:clorobiocin biosynthesis protein CloN5
MQMDADDIKKGLEGFIVEQLLDGDAGDLDEDTPLLELGVVDSTAMVSLLTFIQTRFGVTVPDDKVSPRHFKSIRALQQLILSVAAEAKAD